MSGVRARFLRLGLQRRIMLYVTIGLAAMFATLAYLGLGAIDQATRLVFQERLSTAYSTAGIIQRDLARVATQFREASQELGAGVGPTGPPEAGAFLDRFLAADPSPFFGVTGIWLLSGNGDLVSSAGVPAPTTETVDVARGLITAHPEPSVVLRPVAATPGAFGFATVLVRVPDVRSAVALVHTVSVNSSVDFTPADYGRETAPPTPASDADAAESYHLEVVDPDGMTVLGMGSDEMPGEPSSHFQVIQSLMATGSAAALLHESVPGASFERHVMAVVPLAGSPFYIVLEQPIDVALGLPLQLRQQLLLATALGFLASLGVAWITTRHVVKPTEQLTLAAERMAGGDLASPISVGAQDEIGRLAESLEAMRRRLAAAYDAVERTNRDLELRVAERTERLGEVLRQTISAQEDERRRLARELHDETAQTIAALSIALDRARDSLDGVDPEAVAQIGQAREISARLLAETRRLILGLRPTVLDDLGLVPAIRWYGESTLGDGGTGITVTATEPMERLPAHIEVALFRIVQEALTNVARHANARHVSVHLTADVRALTLTVADDGQGFDVPRALEASPTESVGLVGMQERVRLLGGRLEIRSRPGQGAAIRVDVPIGDEVR